MPDALIIDQAKIKTSNHPRPKSQHPRPINKGGQQLKGFRHFCKESPITITSYYQGVAPYAHILRIPRTTVPRLSKSKPKRYDVRTFYPEQAVHGHGSFLFAQSDECF